jgi:hypothetical protein
MTMQTAIKYAVLLVVIIVCLIYTFRFSKTLKQNIPSSKKMKTFHLILIWIIPFLWILLLKDFTKSTPGSHQTDGKEEPQPFSNPPEPAS